MLSANLSGAAANVVVKAFLGALHPVPKELRSFSLAFPIRLA